MAHDPCPSDVLGEHLGDVVAKEFYFGTLTVILVVSWAAWWYANWNHPQVVDDLSHHLIRHDRFLSVGSIAAFQAFGDRKRSAESPIDSLGVDKHRSMAELNPG